LQGLTYPSPEHPQCPQGTGQISSHQHRTLDSGLYHTVTLTWINCHPKGFWSRSFL